MITVIIDCKLILTSCLLFVYPHRELECKFCHYKRPASHQVCYSLTLSIPTGNSNNNQNNTNEEEESESDEEESSSLNDALLVNTSSVSIYNCLDEYFKA